MGHKKTEVGFDKKYTIREYDNQEGEICHATLIISSKDKGKPAGLIEDVWTHENFRKRGLATAVLKELIEIAKFEKCYKICLSCADHNVNFYKKLGFSIHQNAMRLNLV